MRAEDLELFGLITTPIMAAVNVHKGDYGWAMAWAALWFALWVARVVRQGRAR